MMKYTFYVTTSQNLNEGQGDTQTDVSTDRETKRIVQTGKPMGIETTHPIGFGFSWRIIQL